jgi:hypothetical protein
VLSSGLYSNNSKTLTMFVNCQLLATNWNTMQ